MKPFIAISLFILLIVASHKYPDWYAGKWSSSDEFSNDATTGERHPPNWEDVINSPTIVSNKLFVDVFKTLKVAQSAVGNDALRNYKSVLKKVQHLANHYSETDLVVRLFSGEPVLSGKSLQQIEMRVSKLNALPDEVLKKLDRSSKGRFSLTGKMVNDDVLEHLQNVQIAALRLDDSHITDAGLCHLQNTTKISHLSLKGTQITDIGMTYIGSLMRLVTLDIRNTRITDVGLGKLMNIPSLESLLLDGTDVTSQAVAALETALPDCDIKPASTNLVAAKASLKPAGPNMSSPEKTLALYFGSRTWGERLKYTDGSAENLMKNKYGQPSDKVLWPTGVTYKIEKITNAAKQNDEQVGATIVFNAAEAETFDSQASLLGSFTYFLTYKTDGGKTEAGPSSAPPDGIYKIDWAKSRDIQQKAVASLETAYAERQSALEVALREAQYAAQNDAAEARKRREVAEWNLYDAAVLVRLSNVQSNSFVAYATFIITNRSRTTIDHLSVNITSYRFNENVNIFRLDSGKSFVATVKLDIASRGRHFRNGNWRAGLNHVRLRSLDGRTFDATNHFTMR